MFHHGQPQPRGNRPPAPAGMPRLPLPLPVQAVRPQAPFVQVPPVAPPLVINNNVGQVDLGVRDDDMVLHWYTPMLPVASRRQTWASRWPLWASASMFGAGMVGCAWLAWRQPWRELEARWLFQDAFKIVSPVGVIGGWFNPLAWSAQATWTVTRLCQALEQWWHPAPWWKRAWPHLVWAVTSTAFAVMCWAWKPHIPQPWEPDAVGHPALMVEVTQEEALDQPTHFVCPAGLRALVTEKMMLLERTPQMVQKIKSVAGKWCDDHQIGPFERPRYIAGAVAAALCVPHLEMDLLLFNSWDPIRRAHRMVQNYHGDTVVPDATSRFWQWMRQGRR